MATLTATELANEFDTTPRMIRKFLRDDFRNADIPTPGKGARYAIDSRKVASMRKRFNEWKDAREASNDDASESDS